MRSLIPEQPEQLALLLGSALLLTVYSLRSWHHWGVALARATNPHTYSVFSILIAVTLAVVYAGGAAGLHLCFFSKNDSLRWLQRWVYLPVIAGWAANIGIWYYFHSTYPYALEANLNPHTLGSAHPDLFFFSIGLSFSVTLVALALFWIASWSIRSGELKLPVRFSGANGVAEDFQTRRFVWLMVVFTMPLVAIALSASLMLANPALVFRQTAHQAVYELFAELMIAVPFVALLLFAVKTDALALFRRSLKFPPIVTLALAVAFPMIVGSIPGLIQFVVARVRWAQSGYGREQPPTLLEQFGHFDWVLLLMIISALAEEIAWRGYLQPRLISRYGLYRGIFFVGIVWGAFHFPSDFSFNTHLIQFVPGFVGRLANCVAWGFVLSWLTLRAKGSVIPAGISHGLMNALYSMGWTGGISNWVIYFVWAVLAVLLYRYWPPTVPTSEAMDMARDDEFRDIPHVEAGTA